MGDDKMTQVPPIYFIMFTIYMMYGIGYGAAAADSVCKAVLMCLFWPFFRGFEEGWKVGQE